MASIESLLFHTIQEKNYQEFEQIWSSAPEESLKENQFCVYLKIQKNLKNLEFESAIQWIKKALEFFWEENGILGRSQIHQLNLGKTARIVERIEAIQNILLHEQGSFTDQTLVLDLYRSVLWEELGIISQATQVLNILSNSNKNDELIFKQLSKAMLLKLETCTSKNKNQFKVYLDLTKLLEKNKSLYYSFEIQSALLWFEFSQLEMHAAKTRFDSMLNSSLIASYDKILMTGEFLEMVWISGVDPKEVFNLNGLDINQLSFFYQFIIKILKNPEMTPKIYDGEFKKFLEDSFVLDYMKFCSSVRSDFNEERLKFKIRCLETLEESDQLILKNFK